MLSDDAIACLMLEDELAEVTQSICTPMNTPVADMPHQRHASSNDESCHGSQQEDEKTKLKKSKSTNLPVETPPTSETKPSRVTGSENDGGVSAANFYKDFIQNPNAVSRPSTLPLARVSPNPMSSSSSSSSSPSTDPGSLGVTTPAYAPLKDTPDTYPDVTGLSVSSSDPNTQDI